MPVSFLPPLSVYLMVLHPMVNTRPRETVMEDDPPLLLAGPDVAHDVIDAPVSHVDLLPTFLAWVQAEPRGRESLPGVSLLDHRALLVADRSVFAEYHANGSVAASFMVRHGRYKYIEYVGERPQLFDITADPTEMHDLSRHPDLIDVVADCAARLRRICDPVAVDTLAKLDQERRVEEVGGVDAAADHTVAYTPVPRLADKPART